jgi:hypothetical protein
MNESYREPRGWEINTLEPWFPKCALQIPRVPRTVTRGSVGTIFEATLKLTYFLN